jgi:hypothetical protein
MPCLENGSPLTLFLTYRKGFRTEGGFGGEASEGSEEVVESPDSRKRLLTM